MTGEPDPLTTGAGRPKIPGYTSVACLFTWLGTKGDYSSIEKKNKALTGWRRHFSTVTKEGRLNTVVATYLTVGLVGLYMWKRLSQSKADKTVSASE